MIDAAIQKSLCFSTISGHPIQGLPSLFDPANQPDRRLKPVPQIIRRGARSPFTIMR